MYLNNNNKMLFFFFLFLFLPIGLLIQSNGLNTLSCSLGDHEDQASVLGRQVHHAMHAATHHCYILFTAGEQNALQQVKGYLLP